MSQSVGVVVPAYRPDAERLAAYVRALRDELDPASIRVEVDAPSPDVLDGLDALPAPASVHAVEDRRGKGAAITAGFQALVDEVDVLAFADADGSTPAASLAGVVREVTDGGASLAVGSRRHPEADVVSHQTLARRRLGDGFAWLARRLLDVPLYDYQCGAKAMTADAWRDVRAHLYEPGFAWDIELVAVTDALGHTVTEIPVRWEDRPGSTVATVETTLRMGRSLLTSRHRARTIREDGLHLFLDSTRTEEQKLLERLSDGPSPTEGRTDGR
jgi:glycosyltransferase involved in cell wall biosynthesis